MLHMAEMEAAAEDTLLVILSDLQLDKPLVSYSEALHLLLMLPVVHVISSHSSLSSSRAGAGEVPRHLGRIRSQRSRPAVRVDRVVRVAATVEVSGRPRDDRGRLHRPRGRHCPLSSTSVQCQIFICSRYAPNRCTESCLLPSQRSFLPYDHLQCRSHGCRLIGSPTPPSHPTAADESV